MKIRHLSFCFAIIVIPVVAILLWHKAGTPEALPEIKTGTNAAAAVTSQKSIRGNKEQAQVASNQPEDQPPVLARGDKAAIRAAILNANDAEIVFYGRLEDQFGNGVADAEVNFNVQYENASSKGNKQGRVTSDSNGFFTISGYKGASLGLMPKKQGYALATNDAVFRYSRISPGFFVPNANNPIVIKMWKLQGAEPLMRISKTYRINYTPGPIRFDLVSGEIVANGGDMQITVNRPEGDILGQNPQKWSIELEIRGGGFIETSQGEASMTYAAPDAGYQPSGIFERNNGPDLVDKMLFVRSRNGQIYSKIHLLFGINKTPDGFMDISFTGIANTNGSPNWEATVPH